MLQSTLQDVLMVIHLNCVNWRDDFYRLFLYKINDYYECFRKKRI